jgi:peptide deformylase
MSVLPIYTYGQPVLRKKAKPVRQLDDEARKLVDDMLETVRRANGIGLAANQVGSLRRVIVVDLSETEEGANQPPLVLFNPEIVDESGAWVMEEGCLSIPEIRDEVERPAQVRVKYRDENFREAERLAEGLLARVLQHEIDHLNGILFIDHLSGVKKRLLKGRLNRIQRGEIEVAYPIVVDTTHIITETK